MSARKTYDAEYDVVMHYELSLNLAACGVKLPTRGFFTDDIGIVEEREGTRCKRCWRRLLTLGMVDSE